MSRSVVLVQWQQIMSLSVTTPSAGVVGDVRSRQVSPRKSRRSVRTLECQQCGAPAVEVQPSVVCSALEHALVLCHRCNEGRTLVVHWHFIVPWSPHPVFGAHELARVRGLGKALDMSGSRITLLPESFEV